MTKAMLLFLVTSVALGLTSLHLVRQLRAERANAESLQARVTELERVQASQPAAAPTTPFATWSVQRTAPPPVAPAPTRAPKEPDKQALTAVLHAAGQWAPAPNAPTQEEQMRLMKEHMERQRALMRDPEYRDAMLVQQRMAFVRGNPDVVQELGLTSEQADQFFALMAEHTLRTMDESQGTFFDPAADQTTLAESAHRKSLELQQAREAEIAQLLGPQKYKAWQEYQSTLYVRYQANEVSQLLASNGVPLQPELKKPLMKVLAQEQQRMLQETQKAIAAESPSRHAQTNTFLTMDPFDDKHLDRMEEHNRRVRDALSGVLTPEQIEVYAKEQEANLQVQRAQMRAMKAQERTPGNAAFVGAERYVLPTPMAVGETVMYASPAVAVAPPASDEN